MLLFDTQSLFPLQPTGSVYAMLRFPIQPAFILLQKDHCQNLLDILQVVLPISLYTQYYYPAIEQFVNYAQMLPARQQGLFSEIEGLLDYNLACATYTVITGLSYLYPDQKDFHKLQFSKRKSVELYAAFTAALFQNVSLLITSYEITLYNREEKKLKVWNPFEGSLVDTADAAFLSFKYIQDPLQLDLLSGSLVTVILFNHLQTQPGFLSIVQYPDILEAWLAILMGEVDRVPPKAVIALLPFGEKEAIERQLEKKWWLQKRKKYRHLAGFYEEDTSYKVDQLWGERFLNWLRKKAALGQLLHNATDEVGIRRISKKGVLLVARSELLAFSKANKVDAGIVERQFNKMMALYASASHEAFKKEVRLGSSGQALLHQWLVVYNPALIFGIGQLPSFYRPHPESIIHQRGHAPLVAY